MTEMFIQLNMMIALQVITLGFIGGVLSGFIGSGGAFFMTPGMMNLGVPGVVAVGSNITHKFGKALMGSKKHGEMGNVDRKMGFFMLLTAAVGIRLAVWISTVLFAGGGDSHGASGSAAQAAPANLYISVVFVSVLTLVALSMLRDIISSAQSDVAGPSRQISEYLNRLKLPPMIYFPTADVKVSLWIVLTVGLATGYLAGTIGVGGFIGVPAMIYVFGMPTAVAAGTELYLAVFMGAFGALNYAYEGMVDLRLTLLLYLGSLIGVYVGAYGTKVVKEVVIRLVTSLIILLCVVSRAIAIPMYLRQLAWVNLDPAWDAYFNGASKALLFVSGISGAAVILTAVVRAYIRRRGVHATLAFTRKPAAVQPAA
jgi:uncharacterized membrane protein YfcA